MSVCCVMSHSCRVAWNGDIRMRNTWKVDVVGPSRVIGTITDDPWQAYAFMLRHVRAAEFAEVFLNGMFAGMVVHHGGRLSGRTYVMFNAQTFDDMVR